MYASDDWEEFFLMIAAFALSSGRAEDSECISFGNEEMRENILNCARY
jgi:hypothetical protein